MSFRSNKQVFEEFCIEESDELYGANTRRRRSILLQIQKDIDYNLGMYASFKDLELTKQQQNVIDTELAPLFVVPLLFCSAVDLLGRVKHKGLAGKKNGVIFKDSAQAFFKLTTAEATELWKFRCSLSHQYSIKGYILSRTGSKVIDLSNERVVVSVRTMRKSLTDAVSELSEYLLKEPTASQDKSSDFIEKHGFTYYLVI